MSNFNLPSVAFWNLVLTEDVSALLWAVLWVWQNILSASQSAMELRVLPLLQLLTRHFSLQLMWWKSKMLLLPHCTKPHSITEFKEELGPWCCFLGKEIAFAVAQSYKLETGLVLIEQKIPFFSFQKPLTWSVAEEAPRTAARRDSCLEIPGTLFLEPSGSPAVSTDPRIQCLFFQGWGSRSCAVSVRFLGHSNKWHA